MWGKRVGKQAKVTHLLFVEDTLIFCQGYQDYITSYCWPLMWFEALLGLRINLEKNELILIERVDDVEALASKLGCKVDSLPSTYLGFPITSHWEPGMM